MTEDKTHEPGTRSFIHVLIEMTTALNRLKQYAKEIKFLMKMFSKTERSYSFYASSKLVTSLCECASNTVKGKLPFSRFQEAKLQQETHQEPLK